MKRFLLVLATVLLPGAAGAVQVPLRYDLDAKALKAAVAGTPLTFSFHGDAACATAALDTQVVNVEDVDSIDVLKRFAPKGAAKPPKTARLHHTFSLSPAVSRYFVAVTGTGVTPVGSACQEQHASPSVALAASVPGGIVGLGGPGYTSLASLAIDAPADGVADVLFQTILQAYSSSNYLICQLTVDAGVFGVFYFDPGDVDLPIPSYDHAQSFHHAVPVTAGPHVLDVACNLSGGTADAVNSSLVATFVESGM